MNFILIDSEVRTSLLPFTFTRPVAEIRIGIRTLREKWEAYLEDNTSFKTEEYLRMKYPIRLAADNIFIDASFLPTPDLVSAIRSLEPDTALSHDQKIVAYRSYTDIP
ncbi:MAG: putative sugar nucleotidyl transferase, partial [Muriicola sp.]